MSADVVGWLAAVAPCAVALRHQWVLSTREVDRLAYDEVPPEYLAPEAARRGRALVQHDVQVAAAAHLFWTATAALPIGALLSSPGVVDAAVRLAPWGVLLGAQVAAASGVALVWRLLRHAGEVVDLDQVMLPRVRAELAVLVQRAAGLPGAGGPTGTVVGGGPGAGRDRRLEDVRRIADTGEYWRDLTARHLAPLRLPVVRDLCLATVRDMAARPPGALPVVAEGLRPLGPEAARALMAQHLERVHGVDLRGDVPAELPNTNSAEHKRTVLMLVSVVWQVGERPALARLRDAARGPLASLPRVAPTGALPAAPGPRPTSAHRPHRGRGPGRAAARHAGR